MANKLILRNSILPRNNREGHAETPIKQHKFTQEYLAVHKSEQRS